MKLISGVKALRHLDINDLVLFSVAVLANEFFPKFTSKIVTVTPLIGVILTTLLCASPVRSENILLIICYFYSFSIQFQYYVDSCFAWGVTYFDILCF
jgi:hypothetical protein